MSSALCFASFVILGQPVPASQPCLLPGSHGSEQVLLGREVVVVKERHHRSGDAIAPRCREADDGKTFYRSFVNYNPIVRKQRLTSLSRKTDGRGNGDEQKKHHHLTTQRCGCCLLALPDLLVRGKAAGGTTERVGVGTAVDETTL